MSTEFLHCLYIKDFDIAGEYDVMVSDAECVRLVFEVLEAVEVGDFIIRVNHVKLLEGILSQSGIKGDVQRVMHYLANVSFQVYYVQIY